MRSRAGRDRWRTGPTRSAASSTPARAASRPTPRSASAWSGALGAGMPQQRVGIDVSKGLGKGGVALQAHYRDFDDYRSPTGDVFNSGATDRGLPGAGRSRTRPGHSQRRVAERSGQRYRPAAQQLEDRPLLLSDRGLAPRSLRTTTSGSSAGFERIVVSTFAGSYRQVTDQDRFATATRGRTLEAGDYDADDFQVRVSAERLLNRRAARVRRRHQRPLQRACPRHRSSSTTLPANLESEVENVSIEQARRTDAGAYATIETALGPKVIAGGGVRADYVASRNSGGLLRRPFDDARRRVRERVAYCRSLVRRCRLRRRSAAGFRDPTVSDRYYRGPTGRGFITGNPDLEPERSMQFDVGMRYTSSRVRAGLFGYRLPHQDLIERYQTATDFFFFRNRGRGGHPRPRSRGAGGGRLQGDG